jgi:hypothetical protein
VKISELRPSNLAVVEEERTVRRREKLFYVQCVMGDGDVETETRASVWDLEVLSGEKRKWRGDNKKAYVKLTISLA